VADTAPLAAPGASRSAVATEPVADAGPSATTVESTSVDAGPPPKRRAGGYANIDPTDDYVVGPPEPETDCEGSLRALGVTFQRASLPVHSTHTKPKIICGAPEVVTYIRGPGKIAYNTPPLVTCGMALAIGTWERILQEEASAKLKTKVARIEQMGTYSCREVSAYPGTVSEHSYANAIDVMRFVLANGKTIEVVRDFDQSEGEPRKPSGAFLRAVSRRANDEDVFSNVLTPFFNRHHNNHFHLDLSRYRLDGTRPQTLAQEP
jgi:hypothetical protein